ncbi:MAG: histidine phosphatase family protein [Candidatus Accumulibacter sp.]|jgi:probable phosphoglycerate mutase|nr:histidine phosphatase family protein [Accumulibacter sp.]
MENNASTRFCIVRHGETDWNARQRMQGHKNLPLNPEGIRQSWKLCRYFTKRTIDVIYSSDLMRAHHTAIPISETLKLPINLLPQLRERNYGRCEGMTRSEAASLYPEDARALHERNSGYVIPGGGESLEQHQRRILDCIEELAGRHAGQNILLVTHGGVLDIIYRRVSGMALENPRDFPIPNAGINWLVINGAHWRITQWAETSCLQPSPSAETDVYF